MQISSAPAKFLWGRDLLNFYELSLINNTKLGICGVKLIPERDTYEMRAFITDFDKQRYHYSDSYSCHQDKMPSHVFTSTDYELTRYFDTYDKTIREYRDDTRYLRLDVDLRTLLKSRRTPTAKQELCEYIDSLRTDTLVEVVYTHCVLTMNMHIFKGLPGVEANETEVKLDQDKYKLEIQDMKQYLKNNL